MKVVNGNVAFDKTDLDLCRHRGYSVNMHTDHYTNGIVAIDVTGEIVAGFYNWIDNAEFYIGDTHIKIKDDQHLNKALAMMDAIVNFKSYTVN